MVHINLLQQEVIWQNIKSEQSLLDFITISTSWPFTENQDIQDFSPG